MAIACTHANRMHQSSHPTRFTTHILVTNLKATIMMLNDVASMVEAKRPPETSWLPSGGGILGCETMVKRGGDQSGSS